MRFILSALMLVIFTGCSVNVIQNTGRGADILEDNDKYEIEADADVALNPNMHAEIPVSLV